MNKRTYIYFCNLVSIFLIMFSICSAIGWGLFIVTQQNSMMPIIESPKRTYMRNATEDLIKDSNLIENECTWEFDNLNFELFKFPSYEAWGIDGYLKITNKFTKVEKIQFFAIIFISYETESTCSRSLQFDDTGQSYEDKEFYKPTLKKQP